MFLFTYLKKLYSLVDQIFVHIIAAFELTDFELMRLAIKFMYPVSSYTPFNPLYKSFILCLLGTLNTKSGLDFFSRRPIEPPPLKIRGPDPGSHKIYIY